MATYQIPLVEPFDFSRPEEWPKWIRRFERFRVASELSEKTEESQVNIPLSTQWEINPTTYSKHLTCPQRT